MSSRNPNNKKSAPLSYDRIDRKINRMRHNSELKKSRHSEEDVESLKRIVLGCRNINPKDLDFFTAAAED